ncbi:MAG: molybdopterin biosynthesis protein [Desulfobacterales bacterium]|nr:molybdopterin biosynthesis protein [Desulfobacterales bacterium]
MTKRNVYLSMKTLQEAKNIVLNTFLHSLSLDDESRLEIIPVFESVGRVLAKPVFAAISSPNFHSAAMDGIAVKAENTFGAQEYSPKELIIGKDAFYVNTGRVMPEGTDSVIMIEHVQVIDEKTVIIESPAFPWQHVRKMGEDIVATELLFPRNHLITPYCIGALLSGGITSVCVRKKTKVLIIPTGSELIDIKNISSTGLKTGDVIESNSYVLAELIESWGGIPIKTEIILDDLNKIKETVKEAVSKDFDAVLIIGGSSAGSEDYSKSVIESLGSILVHGVTIMPGKPVIVGSINNRPVFGIPGYPVSAIIAMDELIKPLICGMMGLTYFERDKILVEPVKKIPSKLGIEEFLRVKLGKVGNRIVAATLPRGAGCITSLTEADGIIRIPANFEGLKENEPVYAELLRPLSSIENTIVVVGSHDNTLDVLSDFIKAKDSRLTLSSSHVGSTGGLLALKKGYCHLAGSHLLDLSDGSYNISYIKKYLQGLKVVAVNLVMREQGLIIQKGNPKKIESIKDLIREDIIFINRQGGSGTRILLDYKLNELKINPSQIKGYENEEYTHMSVAANVLSGTADAGLGIYAAAKALNLDFIPVITEQYDIVILEEYFNSENIKFLMDIIRNSEFKNQVRELGGYGVEKTGEIVYLL